MRWLLSAHHLAPCIPVLIFGEEFLELFVAHLCESLCVELPASGNAACTRDRRRDRRLLALLYFSKAFGRRSALLLCWPLGCIPALSIAASHCHALDCLSRVGPTPKRILYQLEFVMRDLCHGLFLGQPSGHKLIDVASKQILSLAFELRVGSAVLLVDLPSGLDDLVLVSLPLFMLLTLLSRHILIFLLLTLLSRDLLHSPLRRSDRVKFRIWNLRLIGLLGGLLCLLPFLGLLSLSGSLRRGKSGHSVVYDTLSFLKLLERLLSLLAFPALFQMSSQRDSLFPISGLGSRVPVFLAIMPTLFNIACRCLFSVGLRIVVGSWWFSGSFIRRGKLHVCGVVIRKSGGIAIVEKCLLFCG